jgi:hypothetical protein
MKTLIVTSIYANLWGTEFGGRASRFHHYRISLLNMLNMQPSKVVCFTSEEEIAELKNFFYVQNNISEQLIEFKVFNLVDSKYFNVIKSKKNIDSMKTFDRCFEIQYNKFYWVQDLPEISEYDRVYWFDAGLSHAGLFPDCFAFGNTYERNFQFNVFNEEFLKNLNETSEDDFILVCKNNTGAYYWSVTIPEKYYNSYCKDLHVVGGFFGGKPEKYVEVIKEFDNLLSNLLLNENELYMEEQILSCLLYQNPNFFKTLVFDDWYKKENYTPGIKLFYELFLTSDDCSKLVEEKNFINEEVKENFQLKDIEEIEIPTINYSTVMVSTCFDKISISQTKNLIDSVLSFTNFDFILLTDFIDDFSSYISDRVKIIKFSDYFNEEKYIGNFPNFHIKRHSISIAKKFKYDLIICSDVETILTNWDDVSFNKFSNKDFDIAFVRSFEPQIGYLRREYEHFQKIIDTEFDSIYDESFDLSPNPETFYFIVKNNEKLDLFLKFWDEIYEKNINKFPTYFGGVYLGILSVKSNMKMDGITKENKFTDFINIKRNNDLFDFYGQKTN